MIEKNPMPAAAIRNATPDDGETGGGERYIPSAVSIVAAIGEWELDQSKRLAG
jgi:hypothetical protein